jgi:hypothetical protein
MKRVFASAILAVVLAVCAGCAAGTSGAPASLASEAVTDATRGPDGTMRDCRREGGTYNRAAGLCTGGGGP